MSTGVIDDCTRHGARQTDPSHVCDFYFLRKIVDFLVIWHSIVMYGKSSEYLFPQTKLKNMSNHPAIYMQHFSLSFLA